MGLVSLSERGWIKFDNDPDILDWVHYIQPTAAGIAKDPKQRCYGYAMEIPGLWELILCPMIQLAVSLKGLN